MSSPSIILVVKIVIFSNFISEYYAREVYLKYSLCSLKIYDEVFINFQLTLHFYKIECCKENETDYMKNFVCRINNHKNGSNSITAYGDLVIPINYVDFSYILIHRSSGTVIFNITFEYCSSQKNIPPYVNHLFDIFKKNSNNLIHPCPYEPQKKLGIDNFPFEANNIVMTLIRFKPGEYVRTYMGKDKGGKLVFYVRCFSSMGNKKKG